MNDEHNSKLVLFATITTTITITRRRIPKTLQTLEKTKGKRSRTGLPLGLFREKNQLS
jgi:hypothetical protein